MNTKLHPLFSYEARHAVRGYHLIALIGTLVVGIFGGLIMPWMPKTVFLFFQRAMHLKNWSEMILTNDLLAIYTIIFWLGVFELLRVYVVPSEERYIDIFLTKPLSRSTYLLARSAPLFLVLLALGLALTLGYGASIWISQGRQDLTWGTLLASGMMSTVVPLFLLGLINFLFLFLKDTYNAILLSFALWIAPILPTSLFIYRPDAIAAKPWMKDIVVFPLNFIWHPQSGPFYAAILIPVLLIATAGLLWLSGVWLERRDVF
ncbi:MAG: hypothetical protein H6727_05885 [Myxococcales bacterium]|nr:hypothetical protein [Myxococcales bacterium]